MLEGLLHHKKEDKEYLCALVITEDRVDAALWETGKNGKVTVLKTHTVAFAGEWEATVDAADKAVSAIEVGLPEGTELTKVVFGFFPEWLSGDAIKDDYLKKLKQLTTALSLTPLGFVELPAAVVHKLHKDEGAQQTVILVGLESKHVTVSLYKIGKLIGSHTLVRTESLATDVEGALTQFADVEVLPSRMLLYGTSADTEAAKATLLNHPWQKKANFLHFPKIDVLPDEFTVSAVATASASEIIPQMQAQGESISTATSVVATPTVSEVPQKTEDLSEDVTTIAKDLGFSGEETAVAPAPVTSPTPPEELAVPAEESNVVPVEVPKAIPSEMPGKKMSLPKLPAFKLPQLSLSFNWPWSQPFHIRKIGVIVGLLVLVGLVGAGVAGAYWVLPQATVKVLVTPQNLDETETMIVDENATEVDIAGKVLPGKAVTEEVTGDKSTKATGKKTVGEQAKGEITIYNKTLNSKALKKGYSLTAGKLKFTLDEDINVASASETVGSLTYGTTKARATAADIGTASNVPAGTEFTLAELPASSYSARNDKAFEGGTSRDIAVVSREDQQRLREEAVAELEEQAETQLTQKLGAGEKLLTDSVATKVTKETFDKEIGEEASELAVNLGVTSTGLTYRESDFHQLLESIVTSSVPADYEYRKEDAQISVTPTEGEVAGAHTFDSHFKVKLLPKVQTEDLAQNLAGKTVEEAADYMRSQTSVSGVEVTVDAPFEFLKKKLPANPKNIVVEISAL